MKEDRRGGEGRGGGHRWRQEERSDGFFFLLSWETRYVQGTSPKAGPGTATVLYVEGSLSISPKTASATPAWQIPRIAYGWIPRYLIQAFHNGSMGRPETLHYTGWFWSETLHCLSTLLASAHGQAWNRAVTEWCATQEVWGKM